MANINNIKVGDTNLDSIMFSDIYIDPTCYKFNFNEWVINKDAGHEIEVTLDKVIIKKFKPNVWIMHSEVVNGSQNSAICAYIKGTIMSSQNISKYSDTIFNDIQPLDNNLTDWDKPKFRGFCPYALTTDYHWMQERSYTWDSTWVDADNQTGVSLANHSGFRLGSGGYSTYGIWNDFSKKLMFPDDLYDFSSPGRNPANNVDWYYGFMLATPIIQSFDDGSWSTSSEATRSGKIITITKRLESGSTSYHAIRVNTLKACKLKVSGLQDGDRLERGLNNTAVEPSDNSITADGTYDITEFGSATNGAVFRLYGDTGVTSEVTIELVNDTYPDGIIDISENPIIIKQVNTKGIDITTKECWDVYLNNIHTYHKDKTFENCWEKYGFVTDKYTDDDGEHTFPNGKISVSNNTGYVFDGGIVMPKIVDLNNVIKVIDKDKIVQSYLTWNISVTNDDVWEDVRKWYSGNTINGTMISSSLFTNCSINGDIILNINNNENLVDSGNTSEKNYYLFAHDFVNGSKINSITFNLAEGHRFSVGHNMFRGATELTECHTNYPIGATDSSGMFEWCGKLKTYDSNFINWGDRANFNYNNEGGTNMAFCFEYTGLETIPQYNQEDRFADNNTIICLPYIAQMFNGSNSLKTVGPVIDIKMVNPPVDGAAYLAFAAEAITDIRIKNLNHGDWYLNGKGSGNSNHGNLPNLDQESINYLIENLYNLPANYKEDNVLRYNNSFSRWNGYEKTSSNQYTRIDEIGWLSLSECTLGKRFKPGETAISPCHTTARFTGLKIKVSGLLTGDRLEFGSGVINKTEKSMIKDGEYTIDKDNDLDEGFVLYRDNEPLAEAEYQSVLVSIVDPYLYSNPSVKSATLHCPLTWNGKISEDLIQSAKTKGWTIVYE